MQAMGFAEVFTVVGWLAVAFSKVIRTRILLLNVVH